MEVMAMPVVVAIPVVMAVMTMPVMATMVTVPTVAVPAGKGLARAGHRSSGERQSRESGRNSLVDPTH